SAEMIAAARKSGLAAQWQVLGIEHWARQTEEPFDVIFSNAALQWVADHGSVFPSLLARVSPGGALAIQMPGNYTAAAHRIMRELSASPDWRGHFPAQ